MVSFRFHIVSIIAVFLALALGIAMGVTVINEATVDLLRGQLDSVRNEVGAANQRSDALERRVGWANQYEESVDDYLINGRLGAVPVVVVAVRGLDRGQLAGTTDVIDNAGALMQGVLWVTEKGNLTDARAVSQLQDVLGSTSNDPAVLRPAMLSKISAALAGVSDGASLSPLVDNGFLEWEPDEGPGDIDLVEFGGSRVVVASSPQAAVPNNEVAVPLTRLLVAAPSVRVVAVEPGREAQGDTAGQRAEFLQSLRTDASVNGRLSTVDNIEMSSGRVATVIALAQLANGQVGHYGVAGSANSQIPERAP